MRYQFLFSFILLVVSAKYLSLLYFASFCLIFVGLFFYLRKAIYCLLITLLFVRVFALENTLYPVVQNDSYFGYVCGFESHFSDYKFVDFCIDNFVRVNLKYPSFFELKYGDYINVFLDCRVIEGEFSNYYKIRSITNSCQTFEVTRLSGENYFYKIFSHIYSIRYFAETKLFTNLHYPAADLSAGILYGFRANFDEYFKFNFTNLGLTHLIAISGYNVSLFILLVDHLLGYINRKQRMYLYPLSLLLFIFLTGMQASVVRACLMAQIQLLALKYKRSYNACDALIVVIFIISILNPLQIYYDIGLWLSLISTFAIVILSSPATKLYKNFIQSAFVAESLALTSVSFLATFIVSDLFFDNANFFSLITNVLVAPVVGVLMFLVFQYVFVAHMLLAPVYEFLIEVFVDTFVLILNFCVFLNYLILEFIY